MVVLRLSMSGGRVVVTVAVVVGASVVVAIGDVVLSLVSEAWAAVVASGSSEVPPQAPANSPKTTNVIDNRLRIIAISSPSLRELQEP